MTTWGGYSISSMRGVLRERTLIAFMTDNGGTGGVKVFNAGMRGQKGSPWLGGMRAASFWRWPGHLQSRATRSASTAHIDFSTLAALAQAKLSPAVQAQVEGAESPCRC
jgi:arylsulfatase